jgi:hypothetical protein
MERFRELIEDLLYPELRAYSRQDRARLLRDARHEPFDILEWAGILAALVELCRRLFSPGSGRRFQGAIARTGTRSDV